MVRVSPIAGLFGNRPQPYRCRIIDESVGANLVRLTVLDCDASAIILEVVTDDLRVVAIPTPQPVLGSVRAVGNENVAAERRLHRIGRCKAEVVSVKQVVVAPTLAGVHRRLAGPEKKPIAAVS